MGLSERQQLIALIAAFAVVLVAEGVYGYFSFNKHSELKGTLAKLNQEKAAAEQKLGQVESMRREAKELQTIIEEYVTILPSEEEARTDMFVVDIDNFARRAGLKVLEGRSENKKQKRQARRNKKAVSQKKNFVQHRYRFRLEGSLLNFMKFTNMVENHSRFLRIDDFELRAMGADEQERGVEELAMSENPVKEVEILISTYTYSEGEEAK